MGNKEIFSIYRRLYFHFGPQGWWPAKTDFEVMLGAILTQNTSWHNVEKAINNLRKAKLLTLDKLYRVSHKQLAGLIRPSGYYNIKAKRLKEFFIFLKLACQGKLKSLSRIDTPSLRRKLLDVKGIGPETADSILLYALDRPVFVVDAYTKRILTRHRLVREDANYAQIQKLFTDNLKPKVKLFNEYHALLVRVGKEFCAKAKPKCLSCPLKPVL